MEERQNTFIRLGYTRDKKALTSRLINSITGGPTHVFIEFLFADEDAVRNRVYFESSWKKSSEGKNGVRGPLPTEFVFSWITEDPSNRSVEFQPSNAGLPLTETEALVAYQNLSAASGVIRYAPLQLWRNARSLLLGLNISFRTGSETSWTCSETPFRTEVIPSRAWKYFNLLSFTADDMVPGGNSPVSVFAGVDRWIKAEGVRNVQLL